MDPAPQIFHIALRTDLPESAGAYPYRPASLAEVGFVHCSLEASVIPVADSYYGDETAELVLLRIDPSELGAEVRYEAAAPIAGAGRSHLTSTPVFPHVYGPIDREAISGVGVFRRSASGFDWPTSFEPLDVRDE